MSYESISRARAIWTHRGRHRPDFAVVPGEGEESVWDYPRPPGIASDSREVVVRADGDLVARSRGALRVLETASPPGFYLPPEDVRVELLVPAPGASFCEWKGQASYWSVRTAGRLVERAAWSYADPFPEFETIRNYLAFYPGRLECTVDGERVRPQAGSFYGGWITSEIVGPFKGDPGTEGW